MKDDFDILGKDDNKFETPIIKQVPDYDKSTSKSKKEEDGNTTPTLPPISKKVKDDNEVPMVPLLLGKYIFCSFVDTIFLSYSFKRSGLFNFIHNSKIVKVILNLKN